MADIFSLPSEMITRIGDYLSDKDLSHLLQTSHSLHQILSQSLLNRAFEDQPSPVKIHSLLWAIHHGHTGLVRTIVSQPGFTKHRGDIYKALDLAALLGHAEMVPLLITAGYDIHGEGLASPIHSAALGGHAAAVAELLTHGAQIDAEDTEGRTAFHCAIEAPWVIWRKTAPKRISNEKTTQLVHEIEKQVIATIQVLLNSGGPAQLMTPDRNGNTALHLAAVYRLEHPMNLRVGSGILRFLVQAGASLDIRNKDNHTPLDLCVTYPTANPTALTFFLDLGVSPNSLHSSGGTLLDHCISCDEHAWKVLAVLLCRGATPSDVSLFHLVQGAQDPNPVLFDKILTLLLIHGASFGTPSEAGTFFSYAAMHGMLNVMETVLESCPAADINVWASENGGNNRGGTPLQIAIGSRRLDMLRFLVEHGVKMAEVDEKAVAELLGEENVSCSGV